jgi:hypothetical protein
MMKVHQMCDQFPSTKSVATARDVARMVGLSPARFYQLQKIGVFPLPVYDIVSHRPLYTEEQQRECLEVRRRNCGINGRPVLFYPRRIGAVATTRPRIGRKAVNPKSGSHHDLIADLKALGLSSVTTAQVEVAVRELFPKGVLGLDQGEIIRSIFMHLRRQNRGDSVG